MIITKTASIIIIGDEILSGRTADKNSHYIATQLQAHNLDLREIITIPDIEEKIITTVNKYRHEFDYVFTTGGIGPTHDDITSPSIAKAFGVAWVVNDNVDKNMIEFYAARDLDYNAARRRMATFPEGATMLDNPLTIAPGFRKDNVFVMAGVPNIMHAMLEKALEQIEGGTKKISLSVYCQLGEGTIAKGLESIQHDYDEVTIGSYPVFNNSNYGVYLVVRSLIEQQAHEAFNAVLKLINDLGGKYSLDTDNT